MTPTLQTTRVVLVDDHPMMRAGVRTVLEKTPDLSVVGEASSGEQALSVLRTAGANVVLLDIGLPDIDGIELLAGIHDVCAGAKVIMLSCQTDEASVRMAIDGGACGYLTKVTSPRDIVEAVRSVRGGQVAISPDVAAHLISAIRDQRRTGEPTLTAREREVWRAMAHGLSNAEIARSLYLSEHTVKFHVHNLLGKLGLKSRGEAICAAHRRGMAAD
jgi:DNA-binding NarL/FixJ family response regulator